MSVSFEEIGQVVATFEAANGVKEGQVCRLTANGKVGPCAKGGDFCGAAVASRGDCAAVAVRGFVTLNYTGTTAPTVGYCALAADGKGGVEVPESGGRSLLVVGVGNGNVTVLL